VQTRTVVRSAAISPGRLNPGGERLRFFRNLPKIAAYPKLDSSFIPTAEKKLFAIRKTGGVTFLLALDTSILGARVYMTRRGMREEISETFDKVNISDWESANNASSFETATFTGDFDSGPQLQCRAFRREMNRRYEGIGRRVLGITCTSRDDSEALATLAKLDAPGD